MVAPFLIFELWSEWPIGAMGDSCWFLMQVFCRPYGTRSFL